MLSSTGLTRRTLLQSTGALVATALIHRHAPALWAAQAPAATSAKAGIDALTARRAELAKTPITRTRLTDRLELLAGPGGNVLVLHGPDGLLVVDNFVRPAWPQLKRRSTRSAGRSRTAIDTHWHFDHADNNASLRRAGAAIVAHANTKARLSETHDIIGLHMDPEPPEALPTVTFADAHALRANGDEIPCSTCRRRTPTPTSRCASPRANVRAPRRPVLQRQLPVHRRLDRRQHRRDGGGGGKALAAVDAQTRIVPGHGPLGDRAALERYRTMLATVRDRVAALKSSGKALADVQAAKPSAAYRSPTWGAGVHAAATASSRCVYSTL